MKNGLNIFVETALILVACYWSNVALDLINYPEMKEEFQKAIEDHHDLITLEKGDLKTVFHDPFLDSGRRYTASMFSSVANGNECVYVSTAHFVFGNITSIQHEQYCKPNL